MGDVEKFAEWSCERADVGCGEVEEEEGETVMIVLLWFWDGWR